ncbi:hypothetical protein DENIS_2733 [Desulfonema ishimotonii]|uniref:Uncharacterized protein n=1 Tax=Desulfonema ishimotonii TaxID=45657 RepID=A0A401FXS8_9BACT|nr:hypothetical protein [Desulfonema ishimotonii]GBC61771.1 hypothetical protein DENIS_2733 [Desulfonema ishimotonii]
MNRPVRPELNRAEARCGKVRFSTLKRGSDFSRDLFPGGRNELPCPPGAETAGLRAEPG